MIAPRRRRATGGATQPGAVDKLPAAFGPLVGEGLMRRRARGGRHGRTRGADEEGRQLVLSQAQRGAVGVLAAAFGTAGDDSGGASRLIASACGEPAADGHQEVSA